MRFIFTLGLLVLCSGAMAQRFFTKTGTIVFFSKAPMENIEATNRTVTAVLDAPTGAMQFAVQMKGFEFRKALMQQHFNENYVESEKYPKAEFKGALTDKAAVAYGKDGTYPVTVKGLLTLHGTSREIQAPGTIQVQGGKVKGKSTFNILLSDYKIAIPALVKDKVSNTISITVDLDLEPL